MEEIIVHPRIHERHPSINEEDVLTVWRNAFDYAYRYEGKKIQIAAVGDCQGRVYELIAEVIDAETVLIYHAFTPPTRNFLKELGMI